MGKLNIAHHKSYHPYRRDNIERVRRDEEEARLKEAQEEGRVLMADAEARMQMLRERAGTTHKKKPRERDDDDMKALTAEAPTTTTTTTITSSTGHINLFEDIEQSALAAAIKATTSKKTEHSETDKGVPLGPSKKDLNPWYSESRNKPEQPLPQAEEEIADEKRRRELLRKTGYDPLTLINQRLAETSSSSSSSSYRRPNRMPPPPPPNQTREVSARLSRESSERERALELIRRKKKEMMGSATPSTVYDEDDGYADVYNRKEVAEAHRGRRRDDYRHRRW